jgi:predicted dehydrogenase
MYHIGIIGCGKIAQVRHIPEYRANKECKLAGFYDLNVQRAQGLALAYGGKAYSSVEELLSSDIDAVSICTANKTHYEMTVKALAAGKHVLCEKPMALSLDACRSMVEASRKAKGILMIDQNQRLTPTHQKARDLIGQGAIGKVISFATTFGHGGPENWSVDPGKSTWFFDRKIAGIGAMADLGVHKTDLIQYLLSDTVAEVTARLCTLEKKGPDGKPIGVDDNAFCIYRMKGGAVGTMRASWTFHGGEDNSTVIYGTEGTMKIYTDPRFSIIVNHPDGTQDCYAVDAIQTNDNQTTSHVIDAFVASMQAGSPAISAQSVMPAMEAVFAAIESSETGRTVKVGT